MSGCSFCETKTRQGKLILKLKPQFLKQLNLKSDAQYWACEDHFHSDSVQEGKRRRWSQDAQLNLEPSDVKVNQDAVDSLKSDHIYSKVDAVEECSGLEPDYSSEAENLALGTDFFLDSQSVLCREETIQDEDTSETSALVASQVSRRIGWKNSFTMSICRIVMAVALTVRTVATNLVKAGKGTRSSPFCQVFVQL